MAKKKAAGKRGKTKTSARTGKKAVKRMVRKAPKKALKKALKQVPKKAAKAKKAPKAPKAKKKGSTAPQVKTVKNAAKARPVKRARKVTPAPKPAPAPKPTPRLERARRILPDVERAGEERRDPRMLAAAKSGHDDLVAKLGKHTETSPTLTAGDVDAKWEDAYAIGDEAPGGDNPTPDQDRVDDIGKALGVQYQDNEELQGGNEIGERDEKRWELDPASSDDWPHDKDK